MAIVFPRKIKKAGHKNHRSPGARCRYHEECDKKEICNKKLCQKKSCDVDEDCSKATKLPSKCKAGFCQTEWCKKDTDCPDQYGCFQDNVSDLLDNRMKPEVA